MTTMLKIGTFSFSLETAAWDEMRRTDGWRWTKQVRLGRAPALQFTGLEASTVTLSGVIFPAWKGGPKQIEAMRAEANKGTPLSLVSGTGDTLGEWCITGLEEEARLPVAEGVPRKQSYTLTLKRYGDDQ